jgi:AhpC/TSA family
MKTSLSNTTPAPRIDEISLELSPRSGSGETTMLPLASLAGHVIVLFVLGVDCGACRHLAGWLSEFGDEFKPDAEFIGVCVQSGCEERLEAFRAESGAKLTLAHCSTRQLYPALHIPPGTWLFYPTLIFIDNKQRIRGYFVGGDSFFENTQTNLQSVLDELLREREEDRSLKIGERFEVRV